LRATLSFVLAGGEGKRLYPLTRGRSKPAVHFGGGYRPIDFVLSNLVNSGFNRIKGLTQYRSTSLVRHLTRAWPLASTLLEHYIDGGAGIDEPRTVLVPRYGGRDLAEPRDRPRRDDQRLTWTR
jgi:ADP-glucose pyrophosphorylase